MSKSNENTKKNVRPVEEIDFRNIEDLTKRAESGDQTAKEEISNIVKTIKNSGIIDSLTETRLSDEKKSEISDFVRSIVNNYIDVFNRTHETQFETIDEIEQYLKERDISPEINFEDIIETTVIHPKNHVHTLGRVTDLLFDNKLTHLDEKKAVRLDKYGKIKIFASVNYDKVIQDLGTKAKIPTLSEDDRQVLDGIITNLVAGNKIMTYDMIYRGFSGKTDKTDIYIPDDIYQMIDNALNNFRGILKIDNHPIVKMSSGNVERITFDEPILHFSRLQRATVNGKNIDGDKIGIIIVYDYPSLYKFALKNGNEIDTRDIKLLNVPKFNNTPENLKIKRRLYYRVIAMRNDYERNVIQSNRRMTISRKISFNDIFEYSGLSDLNKQRKYKIVKKIEVILNYWRDLGLIEGYTKTKEKGKKDFDGFEIDFVKKLESKEEIAPSLK